MVHNVLARHAASGAKHVWGRVRGFLSRGLSGRRRVGVVHHPIDVAMPPSAPPTPSHAAGGIGVDGVHDDDPASVPEREELEPAVDADKAIVWSLASTFAVVAFGRTPWACAHPSDARYRSWQLTWRAAPVSVYGCASSVCGSEGGHGGTVPSTAVDVNPSAPPPMPPRIDVDASGKYDGDDGYGYGLTVKTDILGSSVSMASPPAASTPGAETPAKARFRGSLQAAMDDGPGAGRVVVDALHHLVTSGAPVSITSPMNVCMPFSPTRGRRRGVEPLPCVDGALSAFVALLARMLHPEPAARPSLAAVHVTVNSMLAELATAGSP